MNERLKELQTWLQANKAEAALLTSTESIFYLSGFFSDPHERLLALAIFANAEPFLVCPQMEVPDAKQAGWDGDIIGYTDIENPWEKVKQAVKDRGLTIHTMAIEKEHMNVERYEKVQQHFGAPKLVSAEEKLQKMRMIKSEDEMVKIREACRLADFAIEVGVSEIHEGKTEMEILAAIEYELKKAGVSQMSFSTMVLTGKNGASPHGTPGNTKVQRGDLVLFDLGVVHEGYCSDITRTVAYGDINDKQAEIYETVRRAQEAAVAASKPGVSCSEIDLTARNIIRDKGYGEFFPHRLGHGLGISVHEYPSLTETNSLELQSGMVYTIEPGIYVPNVAGVRIEDDLLITDAGCEVLTKFPKSLQIIK